MIHDCKTCGKTLYVGNKSGLCTVCVRTDPGMRAKRTQAVRDLIAEQPDRLLRNRHIPPQLREEYMLLRKGKRYSAAEVTQMLKELNPEAFEAHEAELAAKAKAKVDEHARYTAYRVRILPSQLYAARRKLEALENEARRLGLTDLLKEAQ